MFSKDYEDTSSDDTIITVIPNPLFTAPNEDFTSSAVSPQLAEAIHLTDPPPQAETIELMQSQMEAIDLTDSPTQAEALRDLRDWQSQFLELRESFNCPGEPFFYLVVYEFDERGRCKGSCTLRFDDQDPRIRDRSEEALRRVKIRPEDVWFRNRECGVFAIGHKYMDTPTN